MISCDGPVNPELARILSRSASAFLRSSSSALPALVAAFTAIEQICHVRDIEIDGYQVRFQRALDEVNSTLKSLDSYRFAKERDYASSNANVVIADFRKARAKTVQLLSNLTAEQFSRTAQFEGYGPLTVRSLAHYLCSHDQQHLAGLQWLLGKIAAIE
jgi:hypothetical protein